MSQSSIIFPIYMPVSIDSFIEMMNKDELNVEQKNTLIAIKQFIADDNAKFIQLMQLESKPEKKTLIYVAAQNGRHDIVKFLIDQAMKSELGRKMLYDQLIGVDVFDRSIIHWIAQINTDAVGQCLALILDASNQLGIPNYVDSKETVFSATPLLMAVKQGAIANISVLIAHGADIYATSQDNQTALDLIKYTDPKIGIPTMKYFIKNTEFGYSEFTKIHGKEFKDIYDAKNAKEDKNMDRILSTLIAIDIDASIPHKLAQLSALKSLIRSTLMASTPEEANIMLATHKEIDFAKALQGYKTQAKDERHTLLNDVFDKTLKASAEFNLSENNSALLAEASLLLSFQLPIAHQSALSLLILLMIDAPHVALKGFEKINLAYLDENNQFLLTRYTLFSMINMKLKELTPVEYDNILLKYLIDKNTLFSHRQEKMEACAKLQILLEEINNAKDLLDLQTSIKKISGDTLKLKVFEETFWSEMLKILSGQNRPIIYI